MTLDVYQLAINLAKAESETEIINLMKENKLWDKEIK